MLPDTRKRIFLGLLDQCGLSEAELRFPGFSVCRYSESQLTARFVSRDGQPMDPYVHNRLLGYAQCPWLVKEDVPLCVNASELDKKLDACSKVTDFILSGRVPEFDGFVQRFNLLKRAEAPLTVIQFYDIRSSDDGRPLQIDRLVFGEPAYWGQGQAPYPAFELSGADVRQYEELSSQLDKLSVNGITPDAAHILTACEFFHMGDRLFRGGVNHDEDVAILLLYEAAVEALFIREKERQVEKLLADRVPKALDPEQRIKDLSGFVCKVFWLRSKAAHGVKAPKSLISLIEGGSKNGASFPESYSKIFLECSLGHGLMSNIRELARLSIRMFLKKWLEGRAKCEVLESLDDF